MSDTQQKYFDLHVSGIGYLNRAREVKPQRSDPFLAVDIAALHGSADSAEYTYFDCRVSGKDAQDLVRRAMPKLEQEKKVLVGFKLGDLYVDTFVYEKGEKAGQTGVSLKARLLRIEWVKVDGESVYTRPKPAQDETQQPPQNPQDEAA
jgi:hypothetical protein